MINNKRIQEEEKISKQQIMLSTTNYLYVLQSNINKLKEKGIITNCDNIFVIFYNKLDELNDYLKQYNLSLYIDVYNNFNVIDKSLFGEIIIGDLLNKTLMASNIINSFNINKELTKKEIKHIKKEIKEYLLLLEQVKNYTIQDNITDSIKNKYQKIENDNRINTELNNIIIPTLKHIGIDIKLSHLYHKQIKHKSLKKEMIKN